MMRYHTVIASIMILFPIIVCGMKRTHTPELQLIAINNSGEYFRAYYLPEQLSNEELQNYLTQGMDPDIIDCFSGGTLLHDYVEAGDEEKVTILFEHGASVDPQDLWGWAPLDIAAQKGKRRIVRLLLAHGAGVNHKKSYTGWYNFSLSHALFEGHDDVASDLIEYGANPYIGGSSSIMSTHKPAHRKKLRAIINRRIDQIRESLRGRCVYYIIEEIIKHYFDVPSHPETESALLGPLRKKERYNLRPRKLSSFANHQSNDDIQSSQSHEQGK